MLKLTIEASGQVSDCEIVSSELNDDELERKLVQRVRMFRFVAKDVPPVTTTKPIDFFPPEAAICRVSAGSFRTRRARV